MQKDPRKLVRAGARELLSMTKRLAEKMRDKFVWTHTEMEEAIGYLIYFRDYLKRQKGKHVTFKEIFGKSGEFFEVRHFKRGFNSKSITFKTIVDDEVRKWVLKVGHRISPVVDFGDPSTEDYSKEYEERLNVLRRKIAQISQLKNLLPEPQEVVWAVLTEEGRQSATTLVVQPFVHVIQAKNARKVLTEEQREVLLEEFDAFKKLCEELAITHNLEPDLLGEGNLEIVKRGEGYHLVLLDSGFVNLAAPLPITHAVMHFASQQTLANVENQIRKIL